MGKVACKKKEFEDKIDASYECKKCGAKVRRKKKVCKPKNIDKTINETWSQL